MSDFDGCLSLFYLLGQVFAFPLAILLGIFLVVSLLRFLDRRERGKSESWRDIRASGSRTAEGFLQEDPQAERIRPPSGEPWSSMLRRKPWSYLAIPVTLLVVFVLARAPEIAVVFVLTLLVLGVKAWESRKSRWLSQHGETTLGTIVDLNFVYQGSWPRRYIAGQRLAYRFQVPDQPGVEYKGTFKVGLRHSLSAMAVGKEVKVRYLPTDPWISTLEID